MPPRKKTKTKASGSNALVPATTRKVLRGKRGSLQNLPDMPLDILLEIFQYLGPQDLLYLTRTSRNLRKFLLNRRTSSLLWKTAMENAGDIPERLPFLSELEWINLLFSPHCHGCSKGNVKAIIWECGARYCASCKPEFLDHFNRLCHKYQVPDELSPSRFEHPDWLNDCGSYVYIPELTQFLALWRKTPERKRKELVQERITMVKQVKEQATHYRAWMKNKARKRLDELRQKRVDQILVKLRSIGWGEEIDMLSESYLDYQFYDRPEFRRAKPLSPREWESMRDNLVAFLNEKKTERLNEERAEIMADRIDELASCITNACTASSPLRWQLHDPVLADIAMFPEVRAIVELPNEEEVTEETFQPVVDTLHTLIARWHHEIKLEISQMLRPSYENALRKGAQTEDDAAAIETALQGKADLDLADLANFCFYGKRGLTELNEPNIGAILCKYGRTDARAPCVYKDPYLRAVVTVCEGEPWKLYHARWFVRLDKIAQLRMAARLCGLDWWTTTRKDLAEREERFICTCSLCSRSSSKEVLSAQDLRILDTLCGHDPSALALADPDTTAIAKVKEEQQKLREHDSSDWFCARCMPLRAGSSRKSYAQDGVKQHLIDTHGLKREDIDQEDYYFDPGLHHFHPTCKVTEDELKEYRCGHGHVRI